jgi:hypothetical protein
MHLDKVHYENQQMLDVDRITNGTFSDPIFVHITSKHRKKNSDQWALIFRSRTGRAAKSDHRNGRGRAQISTGRADEKQARLQRWFSIFCVLPTIRIINAMMSVNRLYRLRTFQKALVHHCVAYTPRENQFSKINILRNVIVFPNLSFSETICIWWTIRIINFCYTVCPRSQGEKLRLNEKI